jgi:hypothetical protein
MGFLPTPNPISRHKNKKKQEVQMMLDAEEFINFKTMKK